MRSVAGLMTGWGTGTVANDQIGELIGSRRCALAVVRRDHVAVRPRVIGDPAGGAVGHLVGVERDHEGGVAVGAVLGRVRHIVRRHDGSDAGDHQGDGRIAVRGVVVEDLDVGRGEGRVARIDQRLGSIGRSKVTSKAVGLDATPLIESDQLWRIPAVAGRCRR